MSAHNRPIRRADSAHDGVPRWANGVHELCVHYDAFLLDQYGVLHNGRAACGGAADAMQRLVDAGKQVVLLTNSGRSAAYNTARVAGLGLPVRGVHAVVSSGDVALARLRAERPSARCFVVASDANPADARAAGLDVVDDVARADLLLLSGLPCAPEEVSEARFAPLLDAAAARQLPMVCCNPDTRGVHGDAVVPGPGLIAEWYVARGGTVRYFGKPHPQVFDAALATLDDVAQQRTLMVGDMPSTDMLGANGAGIDSAFVLGGVYREATHAADRAGRMQRACAVLRQAGAHARWLLSEFSW